MIITSTYTFSLQKSCKAISNNDFLQMHLDLNRRFPDNHCADNQNFVFGYKFSLLFDILAARTDVVRLLKKVDLCLVVCETPDFDLSYSHIATYIADRYHIDIEFIDVGEISLFPILSCYKLLSDLFEGRHIAFASILYFSQSGIVLQSQGCNPVDLITAYFIKQD